MQRRRRTQEWPVFSNPVTSPTSRCCEGVLNWVRPSSSSGPFGTLMVPLYKFKKVLFPGQEITKRYLLWTDEVQNVSPFGRLKTCRFLQADIILARLGEMYRLGETYKLDSWRKQCLVYPKNVYFLVGTYIGQPKFPEKSQPISNGPLLPHTIHICKKYEYFQIQIISPSSTFYTAIRLVTIFWVW